MTCIRSALASPSATARQSRACSYARLRLAARAPGALATLLAAGVLAGCAINPVTGRPQFVLTSAAREREIGREETAKLEQAVGFVADEPIAGYVDAVGARLAARSPRKDVTYEFKVVDLPEPNAFALPGGYVFVTRGLLALVNSEDELANVLGHEVAHVAARHAVARQAVGTPFALVTQLPAAAVGLVLPALGRLVGGVGGLAGGLVLSAYGRGQETEADRVGQEMAAAAGWDPAALVSFLRTLEREEELRGDSRRGPAFFATHPDTPERERESAQRAAKLERASVAPIVTGRRAFLERLVGLPIGPRAQEGVFVGSQFLHPVLGFTLELPEGWESVNTRGYVAAREKEGRGLVVLEFAEGSDLEGAVANFRKSNSIELERPPEALRLNGLDALQSEGTLQSTRLLLTWIRHGEHVYQLAGVSPRSEFGAMRPSFAAAAASFRPLGREEREHVLEARLRLVPARDGEPLEALVGRSRSGWSVGETAVANSLDPSTPLHAGDLVKVAVLEPFKP